MDTVIRRFRSGEEGDLLALFQQSIRQLASRDYSAEQIEAWVLGEPDQSFVANWTQRIQRNRPFVIECDSELAGFADLQPSGLIDQFFISPFFEQRGLGSALMRHLVDEATSIGIARLYADVSLTAQPLFTRHGFVVVREQWPMRNGVVLRNALMVRTQGVPLRD